MARVTEQERNDRVRRNLQSLKCLHPRDNYSTDYESGDIFCGDCGDVITPWNSQTGLQQRRYMRLFGRKPTGSN